MQNFKLKLFGLLLLLSVQVFSQDNIFLSRDFWDTKPTPNIIDQKIKEGNDPTQANRNNFDGVVYAILQDTPLETIIHLQSQEGNDVNKLTHDGRTYIFWAAYKGNTALMEYLLKKGAKTDLTDDKGNTILNFAASSGQKDTKVYDICIANGADLKSDLNPSGANALLLSAPYDQDLSLMTYFTSKGLDVNSVDSQGNGVFNYVARTGDIELMEKLLDKGVKGTDQAFLFATYGTRGKTNTVELYQYLEKLELNPKTSNAEGVTPLHVVAARNKDIETLNYFLEKGLDVNAQDNVGNTPFLNAVSRNNLEIVKLLAGKVKGIDYQNKKGETALMLATANNTPEVVRFLLENKAKVNLADNDGNTLTYYLINSFSQRNLENFKAKKKLLENNKVNLFETQENGNTWYHLAVDKNSIELLGMIPKSVDINAKNKEGNTALHLAAMKSKDDEVLKFLLSHGAKKEIQTDFEETAYDLASENELLKENNVSIEFLK